MKLGVLTVPFGSQPLPEVLSYIKKLGLEAAEIGCGGYPGKAHCDPHALLSDEAALNEFAAAFDRSGIELSALSCHGNAISPDKAAAKKFDDDFRDAVLLAEKLGVKKVITFSGCPGDSESSKYPNWVVCPWPEEFLKILDYQWNEVLIPYWIKTAEFAASHGISQIAFEMHPGFCVYNPETLLKLRKAVGDIIGANFDPSHLFWQGIDPVEAIRALGKEKAIFHFHAKDTRMDYTNTHINGVLDTKHYSDEINRSWVFRSVGYGNNMQVWRDMISMLRLVGYDHVLSIEHEDSLMTSKEGFEKAVYFLKQAMITEPKPTGMFWA
ncbi:MAG: sugar phosphate isomerase/epimerase [Oscillospiraceae bacterium]|nr:sugar phosphate isomerase/epimerase [Oscillospiraceae bacterium]